MDTSLQKLRAFVETARIGTVSGAATALGIAQPSLSWLLKALEKELGVELFVRTRKGVVMTREGRALLSRARPLLQEFDQLPQVARAEASEIRGRFTLAVYSTLAWFTLPRVLPKLLAQHRKLQISLVHDASPAVADGVIDLRYDFGIVVNAPRHPDLTIVELYADEVRLWRSKRCRWHATDAEVPIICNPNMPQAEVVLRQAAKLGLITSTRYLHTSDLNVITALTAAGAGIGVLPRSIAQEQRAPRLTALPQSPRHEDKICFIWRHDAQRSKAAAVIREAVVRGLETSKRPGRDRAPTTAP